MGFDTSQLASFSMSLSTTQTAKTSQAVSAYGQGIGSGMRSIQEPLMNYREALEKSAQKASEIFSDFQQVVDSVLTDIMTMREDQAHRMDDMQQVYAYQREMIDRVSHWLMPQYNESQADQGSAPSNSTSDVTQ